MKTYKVWIEIEEFDNETGEGETLDAPGASIAEFNTYEEAWEFAERIDEPAKDIDRNRRREAFLATHIQDNKGSQKL